MRRLAGLQQCIGQLAFRTDENLSVEVDVPDYLPEGEAKAQAALTYGAYTALIYATGIFGGFIADRYIGYRRAIVIGGLLMAGLVACGGAEPTVPEPTSSLSCQPSSIGPPDSMIAGISTVVAAITWLGLLDPTADLALFAAAAVAVGFAGATLDIVIDAIRIEWLRVDQMGAGSGMTQYGWRMGSYLAGAGALLLAVSVPGAASFLQAARASVAAAIAAASRR